MKCNCKKIHMFWLILICLLFSGCKPESTEETKQYWIYHVNYAKSGLEKVEYKLKEGQEKVKLTEIVDLISGKHETKISILPSGVELLGYSTKGDVINLNFNSNYRKIALTDEILCRAAIVKNFVQMPGISYVQIFIEDENLMDIYGNPVGLMKNSSFVEFSGKNLGDIQSKRFMLYFANENGDGLIAETRKVYYSSSAPVEKIIVEQLIEGPKKNGSYATLPSNTGIIGVSIANGTVYVNLDQKATGDGINANSEVTIYSIVNSVLAAGNAKQVQISINGDAKAVFKGTVKLNQNFEFNYDLVDVTKVEQNSPTLQPTGEEEDE